MEASLDSFFGLGAWTILKFCRFSEVDGDTVYCDMRFEDAKQRQKRIMEEEDERMAVSDFFGIAPSRRLRPVNALETTGVLCLCVLTHDFERFSFSLKARADAAGGGCLPRRDRERGCCL